MTIISVSDFAQNLNISFLNIFLFIHRQLQPANIVFFRVGVLLRRHVMYR